MKNILCLDGGGIRGIIPLVILSRIEEDTNLKAADIFKMFVGTSTGGIIALALGTNSPAGEVLKWYKEKSSKIFEKSLMRAIFTAGGTLGAKFDTDGINSVLESFFGDKVMGDCKSQTLIPTYCLETRKPEIFNSVDHAGFRISDIARATSAAPTFFKPKIIAGLGYVDGGLYANNPVLCAGDKGRSIFGNEFKILSLGTGKRVDPIKSATAMGWGTLSWVTNVIDIMFDGVSVLENRVVGNFLLENFLRVQEVLDPRIAIEMDDCSAKNIDNLVLFGDYVYETNRKKILSFIG